MRTISKRPLRDFWSLHQGAELPLKAWWRIMVGGDFVDLVSLRRTFPAADQVAVASGRVVTVFNIGGNKFRLIAQVIYPFRRVYVLAVLTHADYSRNRWKERL